MDLTTIVHQTFELYRDFQAQYPLLGSILIAEITYPVGDVASQLIADRKVDWNKVKYTAVLSPLYGLGIHGLMKTGDLVGDHLIDHPLAKAALGPNLWGNLYNCFFFVNNTVGERVGYRLKKLGDYYKSLLLDGTSLKERWRNWRENFFGNVPCDEYGKSVLSTLTAWNVFQYCNYAYVSDEMQTPAVLGAGLLWVVLLSLWSLKGGRKIVGKNNV